MADYFSPKFPTKFVEKRARMWHVCSLSSFPGMLQPLTSVADLDLEIRLKS